MKQQEGYFKSIRDTNIYYQYWLPEGEPKAVLLIAHGINSSPNIRLSK